MTAIDATTVVDATTAVGFFGMKASALVEGRYGHLLDKQGRLIGDKFDAAFQTGEWLMDEKLDGHRCQILKRGTEVTITLKSIPALPAHIVADMQKIPFDVHLDGELVIPGGISTDVPNISLRPQMRFIAFDLVDACGAAAMHLPLTARRELLEVAVSHCDGSGVQVAPQMEPSWAAVQAIWAAGGEGTILKRKNSTYRPGYRGPEWVKVKRLKQLTVTVTGFLAGLQGPTGVVLFQLPNGQTGRCKNLNLETLAETAANPEAFIGRRLVLQCQQLTRYGSPRHPMFVAWADAEVDHFAGDAE